MSAEAHARLEESLESELPTGLPASAVRRAPARRATARPDGHGRIASRLQPTPATTAWNVLAEEIVSFPRPVHRLFLGTADEADPAPSPEAATSAGRRSRGEGARREETPSYGEQWLERELLSLRYRADQGYPEPVLEDPGSLTPRPAGPARPTRQARPAHRARPARSPRLARSPAADLEVAQPGRRALPATAAEATLVPIRTGAVQSEPRGLRRLLPGVATLAVLVGMWAGLGALSAARQQPIAVLPGSVKTHSGYLYVAKPGDTLWSIASRLEPGGDPRPLVAQLEGQLHGSTLVPGVRLVLP